jgi:hypothetical protein
MLANQHVLVVEEGVELGLEDCHRCTKSVAQEYAAC